MAKYPATEMEATVDGGATISGAVTDNGDGTVKVSVGNVAKAPGLVGIRVKAAAGRNASDWLFNAQPFTVAETYDTVLKTTKQTGFAVTLSTSSNSQFKWNDGSTTNIVASGTPATYYHDFLTSGEHTVQVTDALNAVGRFAVGGQEVTYLDVRRMNALAGYLEWYNNPMGVALFGISTGALTRLYGYGCPNVKTLDHSGYTNLANCAVQMQDCPALETWLLPVTTGSVNMFDFSRDTSLKALDMSGIGGGVLGNLMGNGCTSLTSFVLAPSYTGGRFWLARAPLNRSWPLGTVIRCADIDIADQGMSQANVNATINNLYQNRANIAGTVKLTMGGTNAAPSGTALTQIAEMRSNGDTIYHTN